MSRNRTAGYPAFRREGEEGYEGEEREGQERVRERNEESGNMENVVMLFFFWKI